MDAQLKAKWVEALRSGEFTQERGCIGIWSDKHLCCLGVGAYVANPSLEAEGTDECTRELEKHGFPKSLDDKEHFTGAADDLIRMNDTCGKSFVEIADWIEANL